VTYDLKIERMLDAPPEVVFDTMVDPASQDLIFADQVEGWDLVRFEIDLRVGGTWTVVFGPVSGEGEPDRLTSEFTAIDRPRRLAYHTSMYIGEWGRTVEFDETITFEERDGKTLVTIVEDGFETEADRDAFLSGTPGYLDGLQRAVAARVGKEDAGADRR
jgi:uncharacterized protein YndB with AHSA1/START domain